MSSCTPLDIFAFAHWLNDTKPTNSSSCLIRTIINRAYFAALVSARNFTNSKTTGQGGHKQVIDALSKIDPIAANKLNSLRLQRQTADYELSQELTSREAQLSLIDSRHVLYVSTNQTLPPGVPYMSDYLNKSKFISSE